MRTTTGKAIETTQYLIRNACVSQIINTEPLTSTGEESANASLLKDLLHGPGLDLEWIEPVPGRASLVARIEGSDPKAPSLALFGHTDVVPAAEEGWLHDPFGGELIGTEIWGRGAVDMLGQTAAMAVAIKELANRGFRPQGTLIFAAVPDEECGGLVGTKLLLDRYPDLVRSDYALTEVGGAIHTRENRGPLIEAYTADKGLALLKISVRGTPGHTAFPFGSDNALVKAAAVVQRLNDYQPETRITDAWKEWVRASELGPELSSLLVDADALWDALPDLDQGLARQAHACTHCTIAPTVLKGGDKANSIPGSADLLVTVRPMVGERVADIIQDLRNLLADIVHPDDIQISIAFESTSSSIQTPLWETLARVAGRAHPGAQLLPSVLAAQTDARWLRPAGTITYGFGILDTTITPDEYWGRFHGRNERIDTGSVELSTDAWLDICTDFLG